MVSEPGSAIFQLRETMETTGVSRDGSETTSVSSQLVSKTVKNCITQRRHAGNFPANWVPNRLRGRDGKGFQTTFESDQSKTDQPIAFSKAQMEHLYKIFSASHTSSSNMANKGTTVTAFSGLTEQGEPWIIDSCASDHMTRCGWLFSSYVLSPGNHRVKIVDGSYTVVAGIGTVRLSSLITL